MSEKLTNMRYWDEKYTPHKRKRVRGIMPNFHQHELLKIIEPYLKQGSKEATSKIIEIGCAPANMLVNIAKSFNLSPYGIDYAPKGVNMSKNTFIENGLDADNIIHKDFFDDKFHKDNKEKYDIVCSFGFIEHFENTSDVIEKHLNLLKHGGLLIITIPNMRNMNAFLTSKKILNTHNLKIMSPKELKKTVPSKLNIKLLRYNGGVFNMGLFSYENRFLEIMRKGIAGLQKIVVDPLSMLFLKANIKLNNKYFSPSIILIGTKR